MHANTASFRHGQFHFRMLAFVAMLISRAFSCKYHWQITTRSHVNNTYLLPEIILYSVLTLLQEASAFLSISLSRFQIFAAKVSHTLTNLISFRFTWWDLSLAAMLLSLIFQISRFVQFVLFIYFSWYFRGIFIIDCQMLLYAILISFRSFRSSFLAMRWYFSFEYYRQFLFGDFRDDSLWLAFFSKFHSRLLFISQFQSQSILIRHDIFSWMLSFIFRFDADITQSVSLRIIYWWYFRDGISFIFFLSARRYVIIIISLLLPAGDAIKIFHTKFIFISLFAWHCTTLYTYLIMRLLLMPLHYNMHIFKYIFSLHKAALPISGWLWFIIAFVRQWPSPPSFYIFLPSTSTISRFIVPTSDFKAYNTSTPSRRQAKILFIFAEHDILLYVGHVLLLIFIRFGHTLPRHSSMPFSFLSFHSVECRSNTTFTAAIFSFIIIVQAFHIDFLFAFSRTEMPTLAKQTNAYSPLRPTLHTDFLSSERLIVFSKYFKSRQVSARRLIATITIYWLTSRSRYFWCDFHLIIFSIVVSNKLLLIRWFLSYLL